MSSQTIQMKSTSVCDIAEIITSVKNGISAELVSERLYEYGNVQIGLLTLEKYFFRNGSYATLIIMLTKADGVMTADIIGSGGGEGPFNISWGANTDFANKAVGILQKYNFLQYNR